MEKNDLPSSDDSDADFVPKEEDYNSGSGTDISNCESSDDEKKKKSRKRKRDIKKGCKKLKSNKIENETEEEIKEAEEKSKIDIDALYADFKKDVDSKKTNESIGVRQENKTLNPNSNKNNENSEYSESVQNSRHKNIPGFSNRSRRGGLQSIISQIGKKDKMSTLQKSQLDWNQFKKTEGIEEEIKMHNRGKDGYLEKQDFLQRTDLRQFEIEKDLRSSRRKF